MAHWGLAYAAGPNYNMPWHLFDDKNRAKALTIGHDSSRAALKLTDGLTDWELALVNALPARYPEPNPIDDMSPWNDDFADAMRVAFHNNRDSLEVRTIFAEALLNRTPWKRRAPGGFATLGKSVELDDALLYDEPWGWMQQTRHALCALLLEQGHLDEAEAVFREDLGLGGNLSRASIHPDNAWSLKGLQDCLQARGETVEIVQIEQRLELANARADRAVSASCFCAQAALQAAE